MEAAKKKRMPIEEPGGDEGEEETEESQTESDDGRREERSERTRENDSKEVRKRMMEVIPPFWLGMPPWMRGEFFVLKNFEKDPRKTTKIKKSIP